MSDHFTRVLSRPEFIALMAALMALNALAIDVMLPALPYMGEALGVTSENERQFVISSYMIGMGVAQLVFGPLTDRFGRRAPLLAGMGLYVIAAFVAIFAPSFTMLLVLRFVQGMGAASVRVIATSAVRDRYSGREMAEVMSLTFMVFMAIPIIAPGIGQVLLLTGPWQMIFLFMALLASAFWLWTFFRLPESLPLDKRRPLTFSGVFEGFRIVCTNRVAFSYGLAGTFLFGALFGFISSSQQIYVDIYGLGVYFPVAFAAMAGLMAVSSFTNSVIVRRFGMRRLSHGAMVSFTVVSGIWLAFALSGFLPLWLFFSLLAIIMFSFGWAASNMNSLSMEPLGAVAGTASAVFGFIQTVGGALIGGYIGQLFDGTTIPTAVGYFSMGILSLVFILIAENGKLFGVGEQYAHGDAEAVPSAAH
ncbi:MAG: multidrug effflux MFS transporter [Devosia sp.]|jgi:DHA1 family bicyclomycin/chloramphenicol resistance-like MFS transporter|uniref:multidrug effflux MFS transporter n=1 Tax=Devosia sp. XGJD_8 TaxID=3391187 RepID=UPI001D8FA93D|nr:multidrug effflux MFS transporter [Alphaproteobacteria bacterium]MBU1559443.1 multidrug effflux MFS transporter [Alphaproteobacteria bacterium]MBU2301495.1 multidrug effflux MFS transporter [Alphaproteobacteria bacterium]MBU2369776.1 multidrug effflux MFS transporter [Alphaproteobacteria bacterium]